MRQAISLRSFWFSQIQFCKPLLCRFGLHKWVTMRYRKKDRMLIVWEECSICKRVKDE
ncbi:MAG TPA: hypothetical protein VLS90_08410 [Thermodesulfobacteriota bacterium]|nr:hypothetical protein [Thermodesulfobacteriota bacterium]